MDRATQDYEHFARAARYYPGLIVVPPRPRTAPPRPVTPAVVTAAAAAPPQIPPDPEPWPVAARWLARLRTPEEAGVGDTIHRLTGRAGKLYTWATKQIGIDCGCQGKRDALNRRYPYPPPPR